MKASKLNYLKSTSPSPCDATEILELIQNNPAREKIELARTYSKNHKLYNKIKFEVPVWMPHGIFSGGVSDKSLTEYSSLIYFDIDHEVNVEQVKSELKRFPFVWAAWKSFGGDGLGFIVQVEGVTCSDSFKDAWNQIALEIDLPLDNQAKSISRKNVISYDPNIWINENCCPYKYKKKKNSNIKDKIQKTLATYTQGEEKQYEANVHPSTPVNVATRINQEEFCGEAYLYFDKGRDYCDIFIADAAIPSGRRKWSLQSIIAKLIYLNPGHHPESLFKYVLLLNEEYCKPPMEGETVNEIFSFLWQRYLDNKLYVSTRKKLLWFNPKVRLGKREVGQICQTVSAIKRKENTIKKIHTGFNNLRNRSIHVSHKALAEASGVTTKTLQRRKNEFQFEVDIFNNYLPSILAGNIDPPLYSCTKAEAKMFRRDNLEIDATLYPSRISVDLAA